MTPEQAQALIAKLTPRELEALHLFCRGAIGRRAAKYLGDLHVNTVCFHRKNILKKLDALTISEATYIAGRSGVV